jgi:pimeloyl-ACP methyl ester carboxylesterase
MHPGEEPVTVNTVATPVLDLEVDVAGPPGAPPVLLLHGWPDSPRGWLPVAAALHAAGWRTIIPSLRGCGGTRFRSPDTPRDGRGVALAQDAVDLLDALGLESVPVVGHDWGARAAYTLGSLYPERIVSLTALALPYQPRGAFAIPPFRQARAFWYQWLMCLDAGAAAVAADPAGFARLQWETWSPPGWYDDAEFAATAASFGNPDWVPVTLNAYRSRFLPGEARDLRYEVLTARLAASTQVSVPALMLQGAEDYCDEPAASEGQAGFFTAGYRREVIEGAGHFPHREAPAQVAAAVLAHLGTPGGGAGPPGTSPA